MSDDAGARDVEFQRGGVFGGRHHQRLLPRADPAHHEVKRKGRNRAAVKAALFIRNLLGT